MNAGQVFAAMKLRTADIGPTSVSSSDVEVRRMVDALNSTGLELMRRAEWRGLMKVYTDTPGSGAEFTPLPQDFHRLQENNAVFLEPNRRAVKVITSSVLWDAAANSSATPIYNYCRIDNNRLYFWPLFDGVKEMTLRYISDRWVADSTVISANADEFNVPFDVLLKGAVYRWHRTKGFDYTDYLSEYEAALQAELLVNRGSP